MKIFDQPDAVAPFLADTSGLRDAHCAAVLCPQAMEEIPDALAQARAAGQPITLSGAHTATTGAALPYGGLLLSTRHLTVIHPVERTTEGGRVRVEAGVRRCDLQAACDPHGLLFPPDPGEDKATIGGNLSTHAAGKRGFHFGPLRGWVDGLSVYLASGERLELRRGAAKADGAGTLHLTTTDGRPLPVPESSRELPCIRPRVRR